jgi:hypothetical protein
MAEQHLVVCIKCWRVEPGRICSCGWIKIPLRSDETVTIQKLLDE